MSALPHDARVGCSQAPARGDFVRENCRAILPMAGMPGGSVAGRNAGSAHDEWLDGMAGSAGLALVLPPGCAAQTACSDFGCPRRQGGRYFPLTIAATALSDWLPCVGPMMRFLEGAEEPARCPRAGSLAGRTAGTHSGIFIVDDGPGHRRFRGRAGGLVDRGWPTRRCAHGAGAALPEGSRFAALR